MQLHKKRLSDLDICTKHIAPAPERAGWDRHVQPPEAVSFTDGKRCVRGKLAARGKGRRADDAPLLRQARADRGAGGGVWIHTKKIQR